MNVFLKKHTSNIAYSFTTRQYLKRINVVEGVKIKI